jgi:nicotinamidase-related amidase
MAENTTKQALLVVDVQVGVMASSINAAAVIERIRVLVARARERGVPVIWVRHRSEGLVPDTADWQIVPELVPASGEPIVEKTYGDSFAETDLAERLADAGATGFVLCGAQSDACIRSTFYGGIYRGYPVTLVSDAHTTEDLSQWGVEYTPEQAIAMINTQAQYTQLPNVSGSVVTAEEAFE